MALRFTDSFDACSSSSDLSKKWASVGTGWVWSSGAGKFGGGAAYNDGTNGSGNLIQSAGARLNNAANVVGMYFKANTSPGSTLPFFRVYSSAAAAQWSLRLNSSGTVTLYGVSGDNTAEVNSLNSICDNNFHWIEAYCTGGAQGLYVDNILQGTNTTAGTATADHFALISISGVQTTIDDILIYDNNTGVPTTANTPLNARQITVTRPTSDGTVGFATVVGGTGSHASAVNEVSPDGDTSYVQDGTNVNFDLYNFGALGFTPQTITAAMLNFYVENQAGGTININSTCSSNGTIGNGTAQVTPGIYQTLQFPYPTDPHTSAAWTPTNLNNAQFGPLNA